MEIVALLLLAAIVGGGVGFVVGLIANLFTRVDPGEAAGAGAAFSVGLVLLYPLYLIVLDIIQRIR